MAGPTEQNFSMRAGDDMLLRVTVAADVALTLTGATVRWWMAKTVKKRGDQVQLKKSSLSAGGIEITNESERIFEITLLQGDTLDVKPGEYYHEAEIETSVGAIATVMFGTMTLEDALVRPEV